MTLQESREAVEFFKLEYEKTVEQHKGFPSLEEFDGEFDVLEHIGREKLYPRSIVRYCRWAMMQAIGSWMGYLHGFILPNPQHAPAMEEYNFLSEEDKRQVVQLLNWHMYRTREMNLLQLQEDDAKSAAFVAQLFADWLKHKPALEKMLEKTMVAWKQRLA